MNNNVNTMRSPRPTRGFTILEVVVAMIIISILTLIIMPTVTNRANQARIASAEADMQTLAEAESRASIDMNYYIVPWRLNNVIGSVVPRLSTTNDDQSIHPDYANYDDMFINIVTLDIPGNVNEIHDDFIENETDFGWRGPYVNFKRDDNGNNWPEDPWGNDYILFTKAGGLFAPEPDSATNMQFETTGPSFIQNDGTTNAGISGLDGQFDRPAWISLGPNEIPGDGSGIAADRGDAGFYGNDDDIIVEFEGLDGSTGP